jgi:CubicO group peptidase (beta-lactamase class C family)
MKSAKFLSGVAAAAAVLVLAGCAGRMEDGALARATPESMGMDSQKLSQVDAIVESFVEDGSIPGAVLSVVRGDKIIYLKAYGNSQVVPDTVSMTTDAVFDLASVSKCVGTTLSFMQLVENGRVRLTDDVNMYIPDFAPWTDPETDEKVDITVRDLLTHTSGIAPYVGVPAYVERFGAATPDSLIRYIATEVRRNFRPGSDYMYSCLNFITLQNILQNVTGEKLCDYAQKNVFDVLGLKHTCYNPQGETLALCAPTEVQEDGLPLVGQVHDPIARIINCGNSGNAGVFSSAEDLSVIAAAIMNGGSIHGRRILSPLTVETMATVPPQNNPAVGRALGWDVCSDSAGLRGDLFSRTRTLCHTGYTGTSMIMDLDSRTAVILLTNRVHPYDEGGCGRLRALVANAVAGSIEEL